MGGSEQVQRLPDDESFDALSKPIRGAVLNHLDSCGRSDFNAIAEGVVDTLETRRDQGFSETEKVKTHVGLQQVHLPKLEYLNCIDMDSESSKVEITSYGEQVVSVENAWRDGPDIDGLSLDAEMEVLKRSRTRSTLSYLKSRGGVSRLRQIIDFILEEEGSSTASDRKKELYATLHWVHLPTLTENNIVRYDSDGSIVRLTPEGHQLVEKMQSVSIDFPELDRHSTNSNKSTKVVVILGHELQSDEEGPQLSQEGKERVKKGIRVFEKTSSEFLILSGGRPSGNIEKSESEVIRQYALEHGVEDVDMILEERSESTIQNGYFTRRRLDEMVADVTGIYLVTSEYHMERAKKIFRSCLGTEIAIHTCDCDAGSPDDEEGSMEYYNEFMSDIPAGDVDRIGLRLRDEGNLPKGGVFQLE